MKKIFFSFSLSLLLVAGCSHFKKTSSGRAPSSNQRVMEVARSLADIYYDETLSLEEKSIEMVETIQIKYEIEQEVPHEIKQEEISGAFQLAFQNESGQMNKELTQALQSLLESYSTKSRLGDDFKYTLFVELRSGLSSLSKAYEDDKTLSSQSVKRELPMNEKEAIKAKDISKISPPLQTMSFSAKAQVALMPQHSYFQEDSSLFKSVIGFLGGRSSLVLLSQFQLLKTIESYARNTGRSDIPVIAQEIKGKDLRSHDKALIAKANELLREGGGSLFDIAERKKQGYMARMKALIKLSEKHSSFTHTNSKEELLASRAYKLLKRVKQMDQILNELTSSGKEIKARRQIKGAFTSLPEFLEDLTEKQKSVLEKYGAAKVLYYLGIIDNVLPIMSEIRLEHYTILHGMEGVSESRVAFNKDFLKEHNDFYALLDSAQVELNRLLLKTRPNYQGKVFIIYPAKHQEPSEYYSDVTFFQRLQANSEDGKLYKN